jgi:hypothetical protein
VGAVAVAAAGCVAAAPSWLRLRLCTVPALARQVQFSCVISSHAQLRSIRIPAGADSVQTREVRCTPAG